MRSIILALLASTTLAACGAGDPVAEQSRYETRLIPKRADTMLAVAFQPGTGRLDTGQLNELRTMVSDGRQAQRAEFVVVTDGSGGPMQEMRAQQVRQSLAHAGARWVGTSVEPAMAMGPNQVVVVRSEYLLGSTNCPNLNPSSISNPNESLPLGFGCTDAYNMSQMLARPRDAAIGRQPGPADGMVAADAVQRYREGRVRSIYGGSGGGSGGAAPGAGAGTGGGAPTSTSGVTSIPPA
jgi:pilus biogenesis lipoprotein CpaD